MGMTAPEIRVLQEFRRLAVDTLDLVTIKAIRHPEGGGDVPARGLVSKGFLTAGESDQSFVLTPAARAFLAIDAKPANESSTPAEQPAEE